MSDSLDEIDDLLEDTEEVEIRLPTYAEAIDPLTWARNTLIVNSCMDTGLDIEGYVPTAAQRSLHRFACDPKNTKDFIKTMVPKASDAVAKAGKETGSEALIKHERRSVAELKGYLKEAIENALEVSDSSTVIDPTLSQPESPSLEDILG